MNKLCVIGCGFVGLTLAVHSATRGYKVVGVEKRLDVVDSLNNGRPHFFEKGLKGKLLEVLPNQLVFTSNILDAKKCNVFIVTVGTPFIGNRIDTSQIYSVVDELLSIGLDDNSLIIIRSTVGIGVTNQIYDRLKKEVDAMVAFCPERTIEGNALEELSSLPQIIAGCCERSTERAVEVFEKLSERVIKVSSPEAAEMIKLLNNSQRDTYFAFANEVAMLCDTFGLDAYEVINSANDSYSRSSICRPGLVGGPCLEKDPHILAESALQKGGFANLIKSGRLLNESLVNHAMASIQDIIKQKSINVKRILICGAAFKGRPATDDLRGSLVYPLFEQLNELFGSKNCIKVWDAEIDKSQLKKCGFDPAEDIFLEIDLADLIIIQNDHHFFSQANFQIALEKRNPIVYDFWRSITAENNLSCYKGLGFAKR